MIDEGWSVLRFWNIDALLQRDAVIDTIIAVLVRRLDPVATTDLRFLAASNYRKASC